MRFEVEVKPKDKSLVSMAVNVMTPKSAAVETIIYELDWREEAEGTFVGTTRLDLPPGKYRVRAELFLPGKEADITIRGGLKVTQPSGKDWPMKVKVDGAIETQTSKTWYFMVTQ